MRGACRLRTQPLCLSHGVLNISKSDRCTVTGSIRVQEQYHVRSLVLLVGAFTDSSDGVQGRDQLLVQKTQSTCVWNFRPKLERFLLKSTGSTKKKVCFCFLRRQPPCRARTLSSRTSRAPTVGPASMFAQFGEVPPNTSRT